MWSDKVVHVLLKLEKKGYRTTEKLVCYWHKKNRKYKVNTKEELPGLPGDICKHIVIFL